MHKFASDLPLNFGPTDTAGARHGIMTAMQTRWQDDYRERLDEDPNFAFPTSLEELGESSFDGIIARMGRPRTRPSSIYFTVKELGRLLTAQTRELLDFFADGLDGESIFYQTKTGNIRIPAPLISLLGATTPGNLPSILPRDAHDHGLLSRIIFVYAGKAGDSVPIPPEMSPAELVIKERILEVINRALTDGAGEIGFSEEAEAEYRELYSWGVPTLEFRLNAYAGRRTDHLAKLCAIICLLRGESPYVINKRDVALAHTILALTEVQMDGAYMNLDRSIEGKAFSLIREVIETDPSSSDRQILYAYMSRAGFDSENTTKIFEKLIASRKLVADGSRIQLGSSLGEGKIAKYLRNLVV